MYRFSHFLAALPTAPSIASKPGIGRMVTFIPFLAKYIKIIISPVMKMSVQKSEYSSVNEQLVHPLFFSSPC